MSPPESRLIILFLLTPLREGRPVAHVMLTLLSAVFLLTPLREGRLELYLLAEVLERISTHAPAGGATSGPREEAADA